MHRLATLGKFVAEALKSMETRTVEIITSPKEPHFVGDGFRVHNFIPGGFRLDMQRMNPFIMLDYNSPYYVPPTDKPKGVGVHDENMPEPAFYSYTYPSPEGLHKEPLQPSMAQWIDNKGSAMAILTYNNLLNAVDPRSALLEFLESAYSAGAKKANWDMEKLKVPELENL